MALFDRAVEAWESVQSSLTTRLWQRRLLSGELGLSHYKGFLIETYHNAGLNPQLQGFASLYTTGRPRDAIRKFFQHAISEIGHDVLALSDLKTLGVSEDQVVKSKPLPETQAFFAHTVWNIQRFGAVAYLPYLFHLEYTPTKNGPAIMEMLKGKGVPLEALSFLEEHSTVDINHLKLMKTYMADLVTSKVEEDLFLDFLQDVIILHNRMLESAFENGEKLFKD